MGTAVGLISLKHYLLEQNIHNPQKVVDCIEEYFAELLDHLNQQASILSEKHEGASEMTHYYMGKGMSVRDVAREAGIKITWTNPHDNGDKESYDDFQ